jgi:F-type H+-transporting ATPase subunit b
MQNWFFLATEGGGWGLNLDLFETNVINLAIIIGVLFVFGRKTIVATLAERQARIEKSIADAEQRASKATAELTAAKKNLADSQAEAAQITANAEVSAAKAAEDILATAKEDVARMQDAASRDASSERDKAVIELRQKVAALAMARVEEYLQANLDDAKRAQLLDRSIAMVGGK